MYCKYCGAETENRDGICEKCQLIKEDVEKDITVVPEEETKKTYCMNCGYEVRTPELACHRCGKIIEETDSKALRFFGLLKTYAWYIIISIIILAALIFSIYIVTQ